MSLLDNVKKEAQITEPVAVETPVAKKHNNSDYQKRQREHQFKAACAIREFIKGLKVTVPEDVQSEIDFLCKEKKVSTGATFGKPVLYKIFGNSPKVGDKVTALKIFEETGKGFAEMRSLMKKWVEKQGITVVYDEKTKSYSITAGTISAYVEV